MSMLDQKQKAQLDALWQLGQFQRIDILFAIFTIGLWIAFGVVFATGSVKLELALAAAGFNLLWLVVLVYRAIYFILQLTAAVKLMPEDAARLALAFQRGQGYANRES